MSENDTLDLRIVFAGLWTSLMFCYVYGDYFELYVPHKVEGLMQQHNLLDSPYKLLAATLLLTLPALMISLVLLLKIKSVLRLNLLVGVFYTLVNLLVAFTSMSIWMIFYVFLALVESGITLMISYKAGKALRPD